IEVLMDSENERQRALLKWNTGLRETLESGTTRHYFGTRTGIKYDFIFTAAQTRPIAIATVDDYFVRKTPAD
ncbi:MAG: hypothetical protein KDK39_18525, partial [Leptospiraceae bacterium]|nr:hypothetical protein [Leptospiraceae bacterium]